MKYCLYLVEDTPKLNKLLTAHLQLEGWKVRPFYDGAEARKEIKNRPHLWVLDICLPNVSGYDLLREIKEDNPETPVIFISALGARAERLLGLELGSDDYLPKPFLPRELVLRIHRLLERFYPSEEVQSKKTTQRCILAPYIIYPTTHRVIKNGEEIRLTTQEMSLLLLFYKFSGEILNRETILKEIWGENYYASDRIVDVLISSLRKKLPELKLQTYYGQGYRLMTR